MVKFMLNPEGVLILRSVSKVNICLRNQINNLQRHSHFSQFPLCISLDSVSLLGCGGGKFTQQSNLVLKRW